MYPVGYAMLPNNLLFKFNDLTKSGSHVFSYLSGFHVSLGEVSGFGNVFLNWGMDIEVSTLSKIQVSIL